MAITYTIIFLIAGWYANKALNWFCDGCTRVLTAPKVNHND